MVEVLRPLARTQDDGLLRKFGGYSRDKRFVAVADDGVDFGEGGEFVGSALGVAAGDDDAGFWRRTRRR
jgi:hypothetical protein